MNPIDYSIDVKSPFEQAVYGAKLGESLADSQLKQYAIAEDQKRKQMIAEAYSRLSSNPNPTAKDYLDLSMLLPAKEAAGVMKSWDILSENQKQNELRFGGQIMSAFSSGNHAIGIDLLKKRAQEELNSGRPEMASVYENYAKIAQSNPDAAQKSIGVLIGTLPGGDKVLESSIKAIRAPEETSKISAENKNLLSQINDRAEKLALDKDKLQSDVELKIYEIDQKRAGKASAAIDAPDVRKAINESATQSAASAQSADRMEELAGKVLSAGGGKGVFTSAENYIRQLTGRQNEWTSIRNEFDRIKNSYAIKTLPPGAASDKDVAFALKGMPDRNANEEHIASFLRGLAVLQRFDSSVKSAETDWISANGSLGRTSSDIQIGNTTVPAGTTFSEFIKKGGIEKSQQSQKQSESQPATAGKRSYWQFATPSQ